MKATRRGSALGSVTVLSVLLISSGCRSILRYPAIDPNKEPLPVVQLADSLNPFLLTSITSPRLVVEVDWVEGSKPAPRAIKALSKLLKKYNPPDREIEVIVDQMIPEADWARLAPHEVPEPALFEKYLSRDPRAPGEEVYHVLFVPGAQGHFGYANEIVIEIAGRPVLLPFLVVSTHEAQHHATLWITADKILQSTLLHEFGHPLGLVKNPRHENRTNGFHCTETECLMTHPTNRVIFANFLRGFFTGRLPWDYCKKCQEDIRRSQFYWKQKAFGDSGFRAQLLRQREAKDWSFGVLSRMDRGDWSGALTAARRAREIDPNLPLSTCALPLVLAAQGEIDAALTEMRGIDRMTSETALFINTIGHFFLRWGRYQAAIEYFEKFPVQDGQTHRILLEALSGQRRYEDAAQMAAEQNWNLDAAKYWRLAGRLDRAAASIQEELSRIEARNSWWSGVAKEEAGLLAGAQGELDRRRRWFEAGIRDFERGLANRENSELDKRFFLHQISRLKARLGDCGSALELLKDTAELQSLSEDFISHGRLATLALCGRVEPFVEEFRRIRLSVQWTLDPCADEDYQAIRQDPRFKAQFPECFAPPSPAEKNRS